MRLTSGWLRTASAARSTSRSNGVDKTGPIAVPNTGGWQVWKTVTKTGVTLAAGPQVVRVVLDADGASGSVGNFNWFAIR